MLRMTNLWPEFGFLHRKTGIATQQYISEMLKPAVKDHMMIYQTMAEQDSLENALREKYPELQTNDNASTSPPPLLLGTAPPNKSRKKIKSINIDDLPVKPPKKLIKNSIFSRPDLIRTPQQASMYLGASKSNTVPWEVYVRCLAIMAPRKWPRLTHDVRHSLFFFQFFFSLFFLC